MPQPPSAMFFDANGDCAEPVPPSPASMNAGSNLSGYFHMFRATNLRFFNNMAVAVSTDEERIECLKNVADSLIVAMELNNLPPAPFVQGKLEKRKSKVPEVHSSFNEATTGAARAAVNSSLRALTSVTSHFSKLNPMTKFRANKEASAANNDIPQIQIAE